MRFYEPLAAMRLFDLLQMPIAQSKAMSIFMTKERMLSEFIWSKLELVGAVNESDDNSQRHTSFVLGAF